MQKIEEKLLEWAQSIQDIATTELPIFAREIIAYKTFSGWLGVCFFSVVALLSTILFCVSYKFDRKESAKHWTDRSAFPRIMCIISAIVMMLSAISAAEHYSQVKKCQLAPRLVLIETVTGKRL